MNIAEAKNVIWNESDAPFGRLAFAAGVLCSGENTNETTLDDLIQCLKQGNKFGKTTLVDEYGALALYLRTKRPRKEHVVPYEDFITDANDWIAYLRENGYKIASQPSPPRDVATRAAHED